MENQQLTILLKDKATIDITVYPVINSTSPIMLILPAMGVKASYYEPFIHQLVDAPITNFTLTRTSIGVKLNHFNWVKNSEGIVTEIKGWISF